MEDMEKSQDRNRQEVMSHLGFISTATVVNLLIEKGICTANELLDAEKKRRKQIDDFDKIQLVQTTASSESKSSVEAQPHKVNWLKRKMSKKRWTRRLAKVLFGWEYKKVQINRGGHGF